MTDEPDDQLVIALTPRQLAAVALAALLVVWRRRCRG